MSKQVLIGVSGQLDTLTSPPCCAHCWYIVQVHTGVVNRHTNNITHSIAVHTSDVDTCSLLTITCGINIFNDFFYILLINSVHHQNIILTHFLVTSQNSYYYKYNDDGSVVYCKNLVILGSDLIFFSGFSDLLHRLGLFLHANTTGGTANLDFNFRFS